MPSIKEMLSLRLNLLRRAIRKKKVKVIPAAEISGLINISLLRDPFIACPLTRKRQACDQLNGLLVTPLGNSVPTTGLACRHYFYFFLVSGRLMLRPVDGVLHNFQETKRTMNISQHNLLQGRSGKWFSWLMKVKTFTASCQTGCFL